MNDLKRDMVASARRSLEPYLLGEEDSNPVLEGQAHGLRLAEALNYDEIPATMHAMQRQIYNLLSEEIVDGEQVGYLQGSLSQLKYVHDRLAAIASVLNMHRGDVHG